MATNCKTSICQRYKATHLALESNLESLKCPVVLFSIHWDWFFYFKKVPLMSHSSEHWEQAVFCSTFPWCSSVFYSLNLYSFLHLPCPNLFFSRNFRQVRLLCRKDRNGQIVPKRRLFHLGNHNVLDFECYFKCNKDFTQVESTDIYAQHGRSLMLYLSGISILSYLNEWLFVLNFFFTKY